MPDIMPLHNLNNIMPFLLGGGGAAKCSPIVFLVIFVIISVRHLDLIVFNHVKPLPPPPHNRYMDSRGK